MNMRHYLIVLLTTMVATTAYGMDNELKAAMEKRAALKQQKEQEEKAHKQQALIATIPFSTAAEFLTHIEGSATQIKEATVSFQALLIQQAALTMELAKRSNPVTELARQKGPLETQMTKLEKDKRALVKQEKEMEFKKRERAIAQIILVAAELAMHEPSLCKVPKEKLAPLLLADLKAQRQQLVQQIKDKQAAWLALNKQLNPILEKEKPLVAAKEETAAALRQVEKSMASVTTTKAEAEEKKKSLFTQVDAKIEEAVQAKQKLEDEAAAVHATIKVIKDADQLVSLHTQLTTKEREIKAKAQLICDLKIARAQADGTYSKLTWLAGGYN